MTSDKKRLSLVTIFICLFSPSAFASNGLIPWHLYLLGITVISVIVALVLTRRKKELENFGIKVLVWGVYFWIVTFIQLTVLSVLYTLA